MYDPPPFPPLDSSATILLNKVLLILLVHQHSKLNLKYNFKQQLQRDQPVVQILSYTPAQTTQTQIIQSWITIIPLHSNTISYYTTPRYLFKPPSQTIPKTHYQIVLPVQTVRVHNNPKYKTLSK